jgi:carboxypeptidase C (cathepsin A)
LATNQSQIAEELYCALIQFFALFSELRSLPFFIAGESYAGT